MKATEHWTRKGDVKLFLWNKCDGDPANTKGIVLFVHGSSMASQPTFDLDVPGRPDSSAMEHFAYHGYDTWCVDMEGYGRSEKGRNNNAPMRRLRSVASMAENTLICRRNGDRKRSSTISMR